MGGPSGQMAAESSVLAVFLHLTEEINTYLKRFSHFQGHDDDHDHVINFNSTAVSGVGSLHPSAEDVEKVSPACSPLLRR
jgi:hypothetical protein